MITVETCAFCRRKAVDLGNGIRVVCRRHKNRKIDFRFFVTPYVVMPKVIKA